ncbi:MAG: trans-sulfuration enzyme family protein [Candidatus Dormibacteria bacterium]
MTADRSTRAVRAGLGAPSGRSVDLVAPAATASVRAFPDLAALDEGMDAERATYGRHGNESVALLESALTDLETPAAGAVPVCRVTASGQAALLLALSVLVSPSRPRVLVVRPCYGSTETLISGPLAHFGVEVVTVDLPPPGDVGAQRGVLARALDDSRISCAVAEVIGNPLMNLLDVDVFTALCRECGVASVVDSTFTTPFLLRPLEHGADVVFHSLSKSLSGHSDVIGGAVLVGAHHRAADWLDAHSRLLGAVLGPQGAWLTLRGLRTAPLRVERSVRNAATVASQLGAHPAVRLAHYPGRRSVEEEELARSLLPAGRGAMLGLDLGDRGAVERFLGAAPGIRLAPSLGDVSTTASHPGLTSHRGMSPLQRAALGIGDGLLRLSVGCEEPADLLAEVRTGLDAAGGEDGIGSTP